MNLLYNLLKRINLIRFRCKGVSCDMTNSLSFRHVTVITGKRNMGGVFLKKRAEISADCFLVAKDRIEIGENSTLAFRVTILTTANPNAPYNLLKNIYQPVSKPVIIGDNVWIGACSVILPGVTIGNMSVVAAGSVVTKDVPPHVLVAGVPARIIKNI
ncbi:acyltransferase [Bacteroidales bacterium SW299]|nr:acyltransferase [Bacteroidales bacterium SW299]